MVIAHLRAQHAMSADVAQHVTALADRELRAWVAILGLDDDELYDDPGGPP